MARSRGSFGTVTRSIIDHERAMAQASVILAAECGTVHERGTRTDLCPKCQTCAECGRPLRRHAASCSKFPGQPDLF